MGFCVQANTGYNVRMVGRDSAVSIANCYAVNDPVIESRWGEVFGTRPDHPRGPPCLLYSGYMASFLGVKQPGRDLEHPLPYSCEVKEKSTIIRLLSI
jgi:hypothetical protein